MSKAAARDGVAKTGDRLTGPTLDLIEELVLGAEVPAARQIAPRLGIEAVVPISAIARVAVGRIVATAEIATELPSDTEADVVGTTVVAIVAASIAAPIVVAISSSIVASVILSAIVTPVSTSAAEDDSD